jgi:hypothetical protein
MRVIIDRFEGKYAVCEQYDRSVMRIERKRLPKQAKEGDVLVIDAAGITVDTEDTARRRRAAEGFDSLWH